MRLDPLPVSLNRFGVDIILCRTRDQIRLFQIPITADDFPRFLWEGEQVNPQDMNEGFLRGELLIKVRVFSHSSPTRSQTPTEHP